MVERKDDGHERGKDRTLLYGAALGKKSISMLKISLMEGASNTMLKSVRHALRCSLHTFNGYLSSLSNISRYVIPSHTPTLPRLPAWNNPCNRSKDAQI